MSCLNPFHQNSTIPVRKIESLFDLSNKGNLVMAVGYTGVRKTEKSKREGSFWRSKQEEWVMPKD